MCKLKQPKESWYLGSDSTFHIGPKVGKIFCKGLGRSPIADSHSWLNAKTSEDKSNIRFSCNARCENVNLNPYAWVLMTG